MRDLFRFDDVGECALRIALASGAGGENPHHFLLALEAGLRTKKLSGVLDFAPGWESLLIHYDPLLLSRRELIAQITALNLEDATLPEAPPVEIPVCFDALYAEDLEAISVALKLAPEEIITRILQSPLELAMYGFAPGFAYFRGLDETLSLPRRKTVNPEMAAGSFIIAAGQAALTSAPMPTGWHIAGRTPLTMFDPARTPPVLFAPAQAIRLVPISAARFEDWH